MKKCPDCGTELTQEMIDVNMCWECGKIFDETLIYKGQEPLSFGEALEQQIQLEEKEQSELLQKESAHKLTTGNSFDGYRIAKYLGIVSGDVVIGTGFIADTLANFSDLFGAKSQKYADKMIAAKEAAVKKMIYASLNKGGEAIVGVSFDYITFAGRDLIGVSVNGTSVKLEKTES